MRIHPLFRLSLSVLAACMLAGALWHLGAQPGAHARALATTTHNYPGCGVSLHDCINNISAPGDTVLIAAGSYTEYFGVDQAVSVMGASGGVTIHAPANSRVMVVSAGISPITASTVISGITFVGGDLSLGSICPAYCGGGVWVTGGTQPSLINVVITGNLAYKGGGLYVDSGKTLTVLNSLIMNNTSTRDGGGINADGSSPLVVSGSRIENNRSTAIFPSGGYGGGILADAPVELIDTDVISNGVSGPGGGVYASNGITTTFGRFEHNTAGDQGGGIRTNGNAQLNGTNFYSNTARQGGAVHASGAVTNSYSNIIGNRSTLNDGGALWVGGALYTAMTFFSGNMAGAGGGAIFVRGPATMVASTVLSNTAAGIGGGGVISGVARVDGVYFTGNSAGGYGGGLVVSDTAYLNNPQVLGNSATITGGGGLYLTGKTFITGGLFDSNSALCALCSGGGLYVLRNAEVSGTTFYNNRTTQNGGGLTTGFGASLKLTNTQFISNSAGGTGGGLTTYVPTSMTGGRFEHNYAGFAGGGATNGNTLMLSGTQFISNSSHFGGGVWATYAAVLTRAYFEDNRAHFGGGLYSQFSLTLQESKFISNAATTGGGVLHTGPANAQINNNLFARNGATSAGAALALYSPASVQLLHNTIANRVFNPASGVVVFSGTVGITDTIIVGHAFGLVLSGGSINEDYNLFFGNSTNSTGSVVSGGHDVFANPRFVDSASDNYHLGVGSAAIDHGINAGVMRDLDGDARPYGAGFDIGFDEATYRQLFLPLIRR